MKDNLFGENIECLYHFTKADTAKEILKSNSIRFGQLRYVNDPKEALSWPYKLFCFSPENRMPTGINSLILRAEDYTLDHILVACFKSDNKEKQNRGINGCCDTRMWSQYAASHSGVCLVFDKKLFEIQFSQQECEAQFVGFVTYRDEWDNSPHAPYINTQKDESYPTFFLCCNDPFMLNVEAIKQSGFEEYMKQHIKYYNRKLLFQKNTCWAGEEEYRMVLQCDRPTRYIDFDFKSALRGIVFGSQCSNNDVEDILYLCRTENLYIYHHLSKGWENHFLTHKDYTAKDNNILISKMWFPTNFPYDTVYMRTVGNAGSDHVVSVDTTGEIRFCE